MKLCGYSVGNRRPNVVKVVFEGAGLASYLSRAPIPWGRGVFDGGMPAALPAAPSAPVAVEQAESLEQLRALDLGLRIHVTATGREPGPRVDTEADAERVDAISRGRQ